MKTQDETITCDELYRRVVADVHDMLDFARAEGRQIPASARAKVEELCFGGKTVPPADPAPGGTAAKMALALEVHSELTQIVSPATPRTIRASRPSVGDKWRVGANNKTVRLLLWATLVSIVLFFVVPLIIHFGAKRGWYPSESIDNWAPVIQIVAAASIGSAFYGLYTAHKYIVNFTFDPKYHQVYLIRFVLGLSSGTILGHFGKDLLDAGQDVTQQFGPPLMALVGGYAAEAVSQILQRFSDTLITMVRGSNREALAAKQEEMKAQSKQQEMLTKSQAAEVLRNVKSTLGAQATPELNAMIEKALEAFKPK